jgi:hypothetical protein
MRDFDPFRPANFTKPRDFHAQFGGQTVGLLTGDLASATRDNRTVKNLRRQLFLVHRDALVLRKNTPIGERKRRLSFPNRSRTAFKASLMRTPFFHLLDPLGRLLSCPPDRDGPIDHDPHGAGVRNGAEVDMDRNKEGDAEKTHIMQKVGQKQPCLVWGREPDGKARNNDAKTHPEHPEVRKLLPRVQFVHRGYCDLMAQITAANLNPCEVVFIKRNTFLKPGGHAQDKGKGENDPQPVVDEFHGDESAKEIPDKLDLIEESESCDRQQDAANRQHPVVCYSPGRFFSYEIVII